MSQILKKPLLSVQKFCIENNVFFEFHSSMFYVKDLITKEVLLSSQSSDGLYVLSESSATSVPQAFLSTSVSSTANVWHRHLGHPSSCILGSLVSNNKVSCTSRVFNFNCLGKSSRLSLGLTGHKTCAPLELVSSDVWGPSPMLSNDGYCYFVIFMDISGSFLQQLNLMCLTFFISFKFLLNANSPPKLSQFKQIGVVNIGS